MGQLPKKQGRRKHSAAPPQVHEPALQPSAVDPHSFPHLPQFARSAFVLRHVPLQHSSEPAQVRPHAPQFAAVSVRVQAPPQQVSDPTQARALAPMPHKHCAPLQVVPAGQLTVHATAQEPAVHARPVGQTMPHMPQFAALVCVSTQVVPQQAEAPVHIPAPQRQTPPTQVDPFVHAGVHAAGASLPTSRVGGPESRPPASMPASVIAVTRASARANTSRLSTSPVAHAENATGRLSERIRARAKRMETS